MGRLALAGVTLAALHLALRPAPSFLGPSWRAQSRCRRVAAASSSEASDGAVLPTIAESWEALQAAVDLDGPDIDRRVEQEYGLRSADLLVRASLDRLKPHVVPAVRYDEEPSDAIGDPEGALKAMLGDEARFITEFLSEDAQMSSVHEKFFQAEMYLKELSKSPELEPPADLQPGQSPVREKQSEVEGQMLEGTSPEVQAALEESVVVARVNFLSTARFGYFLRRCQGRLRLERIMKGSGVTVEAYLAGVESEDVVELARIATEEAEYAVEVRAIAVFGTVRDLLKELSRGAEGLAKLEISPWSAQRLTLEAAAFGAALFEAEEEAANHYGSLHYTSFGSRDSRT